MTRFTRLCRGLVSVGRGFHDRGWVMGTSGNLSAVVSARPLRLAITPSAVHKGRLKAGDFLQVNEHGLVLGRRGGKPSAETRLHLEIVKATSAGAVLHTHSVWSTILSDRHARGRGLAITGYEMLKGLDGVTTHEHREWVPILENDQDMPRLAERLRQELHAYPQAHAVLLSGHGLYTWGRTIADAERHMEILEFLLEVLARGRELPEAIGNERELPVSVEHRSESWLSSRSPANSVSLKAMRAYVRSSPRRASSTSGRRRDGR